MIEHPEHKAPLSEPGTLGVVALAAAPVLAAVGVTGIGMLFGLYTVYAGIVVTGYLFGKKGKKP